MSFSNPPTSLQSVQVVTVSVPTVNRDLWYWPSVAGEPFPPSTSGYTGRQVLAGQPCYSVSSSPPGNATWKWTFPTIPYRKGKPARVTTGYGVLNVANQDNGNINSYLRLTATNLVTWASSAAGSRPPVTMALPGGPSLVLSGALDPYFTVLPLELLVNADLTYQVTIGAGTAAAVLKGPAIASPPGIGLVFGDDDNVTYTGYNASGLTAVQVSYS